MKLPLRQLARHLERAPAPAYLVAADEPLLVDQALAQIRAAGVRAGFTERELHTMDRSSRWDELRAGASNLSLFGSRRLLELRLATPRPGDAGSACLRALLENPDPDRMLVVAVAAKLDAAASRSVWAKAFDTHGVVVDIWPVERAELPAWIRARAKEHGIDVSADAAQLLADRVEGNLLAAEQEIVKLSLTEPNAKVGEREVLDAVASSARFDVFLLTDAILAGDAVRAMRVLAGLRAEGVPPTLVLWAIVRELTLLARLQFAAARGEGVDNALARLGVWRRRQPIVKQASRRMAARPMAPLLARAAEVDAVIKGASHGEPWAELTALVMAALAPPQAPGAALRA